MKIIKIVYALVIICVLMVGCGPASKVKDREEPQWQEGFTKVSEVKISGHTYIFARSTVGIAICPSAETLRWANSQEK